MGSGLGKKQTTEVYFPGAPSRLPSLPLFAAQKAVSPHSWSLYQLPSLYPIWQQFQTPK